MVEVRNPRIRRPRLRPVHKVHPIRRAIAVIVLATAMIGFFVAWWNNRTAARQITAGVEQLFEDSKQLP